MVNGLWFILGIIELYLQIWYRYLTKKRMTLITEACEISKNIVSFGSRAHSFHKYFQADLKNEEGFYIDVVLPFGKKFSNIK
jgi:hypothetical protein